MMSFFDRSSEYRNEDRSRSRSTRVRICWPLFYQVIVPRDGKNVQTVQTRLCYFFSVAVLIFWLCTRKLDNTLC